jgi:hypothetical protein
MTSKSKRYMNINGVVYDIRTGQVVHTKDSENHVTQASVLDLRTPRNESTLQPIIS